MVFIPFKNLIKKKKMGKKIKLKYTYSIFISLYNINKHECNAKSIYLNDTKKYILITIIIESSNKHRVCACIYTIYTRL